MTFGTPLSSWPLNSHSRRQREEKSGGKGCSALGRHVLLSAFCSRMMMRSTIRLVQPRDREAEEVHMVFNSEREKKCSRSILTTLRMTGQIQNLPGENDLDRRVPPQGILAGMLKKPRRSARGLAVLHRPRRIQMMRRQLKGKAQISQSSR